MAGADERVLPLCPDRVTYRTLQKDTALWTPAVRAICANHGLATGRLEKLSGGTNVVYSAGDRIIKLFPPHWERNAVVDRAVAERLYCSLPVATPAIEATGVLEGWPYLVLERLNGRPLQQVWDSLAAWEQERLARELGEVTAAIHAVPTTDLQELEADWIRYIDFRLAACVERHQEQQAPIRYLAQIEAFLASAAPLYPAEFAPAIVSADIHQWHLLVEEGTDGWRLCGLFDFDDARSGFVEYDLAAPCLFLMAGRPRLLRAFLGAYGYRPGVLDEALSRRLLAYTLLHPDRDMRWWLAEFVPQAPDSLNALAQAVYAFH